MSTYGRQVVNGGTGEQIQVTADGDPRWKTGGITLDWATVAAVAGAAVDVNNGLLVAIGNKYLRYGQILCEILATGKYGPYDPLAADGREVLEPGRCWILNETVLMNGVLGLPTSMATDHPGVFDGGRIYIERIIQSGAAAHSLAAGPTLAEFLAAFPNVQITRF